MTGYQPSKVFLFVWRTVGVLAIFWWILTRQWWMLVGIGVAALTLTLLWTWWDRRTPPCMHPYVRCVHGDEINQANGARVACIGCGEYLRSRRGLEVCTVTGRGHDWDGRPWA